MMLMPIKHILIIVVNSFLVGLVEILNIRLEFKKKRLILFIDADGESFDTADMVQHFIKFI